MESLLWCGSHGLLICIHHNGNGNVKRENVSFVIVINKVWFILPAMHGHKVEADIGETGASCNKIN